MWNTILTRSLGIRYPIIQAPMAGGPSTPQLVAAVSNAGGLGSLGCGYLTPDGIRDEIRSTRKLTDKPFAVALFTPGKSDPPSPSIIQEASRLLDPYRKELGLPLSPPSPTKFGEALEEQLQVILEEKPPVFAFTFGVPPEGFLRECRKRGIWTMGTATNAAEVRLMRDSPDPVDFVFAQGCEAGGHRGAHASSIANDTFTALLPLVPQLVKENVPIIAAGGIMDGSQIVAALDLGACGVSMGTAFLLCPESGTSAPYRAALRNEAASAEPVGTAYTRVISGRLARGIRNRFMREMEQFEGRTPGYPYQYYVTQPLRKACVSAGRSDFISMWAGQGVSRIRELPATDLLARLVTEAEQNRMVRPG
ncbi:putative nitronate monooxygenase [Hypsibius exemplaris]|uniref:Nitronate monooxygenase n=1 Tax=Hypsibius exemplaris TaxID=2072580 RepID=A0A1W0WT72_HYPEX|nr:putative nitronate monooxygenase [Hypsibius exemplaris]